MPMPSERQPAPELAGAELSTVSAVIPAYNAAETIQRALNSVYAQTYPNIIEVIVVDDGSTDATAQIVREKFPDATFIQQENAGVSVARNAGVDAARGELIAFLDADDEWLPEKTEVHVAVMKAHPGLVLCLCDSAVCGTKKQATEDDGPLLHHVTFREAVTKRKQKHWGCSVWLARREALLQHRFDPRLRRHQDLELIKRLAGLGYGVVFYSRQLSVYYPCLQRRVREEVSAASARRKLLLGDREAGIGAPWATGWLTDRDQKTVWLRQRRVAADVLCLTGDDGAANELAREALQMDGGAPADRVRLWIMAHVPRFYGGLRRSILRLATK